MTEGAAFAATGAPPVPELIVVSHRGPVRIDPTPRRAGGGLVTALSDLVRHAPHTTWVCAATTEDERKAAIEPDPLDIEIGTAGDPAVSAHCRVRFVATDPEQHHRFYAVIANPMLWFIQHGLWDHARTPTIGADVLQAWYDGYLPVNEAFADEVADAAEDAAGDAVIMVHDYHFYTLPRLLRERRVRQVVHFFVHIPWPAADAWRVLPPEMRDAIVEGLLHADVVGFHTERYARNFLATCADLLRLEVHWPDSTVRYGGRVVSVRFYPISVDASSLRTLAHTPEAADHRAEVAATRAEQLILRVDRADPSKNILRGFAAFDRLCELHPEVCGRVTFLALIQPTREHVREYRDYREEIEMLAEAINARWGTDDWTPIDLRIVESLPLAVAAYQEFDVLMVNALADGMNLVAKEALLVNERDGVLALSELAGAYAELGAVAVTLYPYDIEQQAEALWHALTMDGSERRRRHDAGVEIVTTNNVAKWLSRQLEDLDDYRRISAAQ
ncbi:MAG TPA: trehalose-6-phosphate synthase [Acidimicrobiia bacterium]|jgi:trehalose 6-phosphate synthase